MNREIPRPGLIEIILFTVIGAIIGSIIIFLIFFFKQIHRRHWWLPFFITFSSLLLFNVGVYYIYGIIKLYPLLYSSIVFIVFWLFKFILYKENYANENWLDEDYWRELDAFDFEEEIANFFREMGYKAKVTQKSVDYGVDVIVWIKNRKGVIKTAVQCKRYNGHPATCSEVRDLWGAKEYYNCKGAIMVALDGVTKQGEQFIDKFENYSFMTIDDIIEKAATI